MKSLMNIKNIAFYLSFPLQFISFVFPILAFEYGANSFQLGVIFGTLSLSSILVKPIIGYLTDLKGYKTSLISGIVLYIISLFLLYSCDNYAVLLLSSLVSSFASNFINISYQTFVLANSSEDEISHNSGVLDQWIARGGAIGAAIGFTLYFNNVLNGMRPIFLVYILFMIIGAFYVTKDLKNIPTLEAANKKSSQYKFLKINDFKNLNSNVKLLLVVTFTVALGAGMLSPVFLSYLKETVAIDNISLSYIYIPGAILSMILPNKIGSFVDKSNKGTIIKVSIILGIAYWVAFPLVKSFNVLIVLFTAIGVVGMFSGLASVSVTKSVIGQDNLGYKVGFFGLASALGSTIGSISGGYIYAIGGIVTIVTIKIILSICSLYLYSVFFSSEKKQNLSSYAPVKNV